MTQQAGVQLFTVRQYTKTPRELEATIRKLYAMGFMRFELARIRFDADELAVLLRLKNELHLTYTACQVKLKEIQKRFDWFMMFLNALQIPYLEVSVIPLGAFLGGKDALLNLASTLIALGARTREKEIELLYHHHNFELIRLGEETGLDLLLRETDARAINLVADTYWLARSGFCPGTFIAKHGERIKGIHLRDCRYYFRNLQFSFQDCAVGDGSVDFSFVTKLEGVFLSIEQATDKPFVELERSRDAIEQICRSA